MKGESDKRKKKKKKKERMKMMKYLRVRARNSYCAEKLVYTV